MCIWIVNEGEKDCGKNKHNNFRDPYRHHHTYIWRINENNEGSERWGVAWCWNESENCHPLAKANRERGVGCNIYSFMLHSQPTTFVRISCASKLANCIHTYLLHYPPLHADKCFTLYIHWAFPKLHIYFQIKLYCSLSMKRKMAKIVEMQLNRWARNACCL